MAELRVAILTCSDSGSTTEAEDTVGRSIIALAEKRGWLVVSYHVCQEDRECISASLMEMADVEQADAVFTLGAIGIAPRDVAPEAVVDVSERIVPGIAEHIRAESLRSDPLAVFSRGTAGLRGSTLIINLPGAEKAAREAFNLIAGHLTAAIETLRASERD